MKKQRTQKPIDIQAEPVSTTAIAVREQHQMAITPALRIDQLKDRLKEIHDVMQNVMVEKQDYGKVPGCGDKPGLFQPGAQKLSMMFQLNPEVLEETVTDYPNFHRGYRLIVRVTNGSKFADGVGECSTMESKYRFRNALPTCPKCNKAAIIKGKQEFGGRWLCHNKRGGCGAKWPDGSEGAKYFESQGGNKVEGDNPADFWNTVRKMAFKRGFVHAIINATNTSELWSQDLEDLAANGVVGGEAKSETQHEKPHRTNRPKETGGIGAETPAQRTMFLHAMKDIEQELFAYSVENGIISDTQTLEDWPLDKVPMGAGAVGVLRAAVKQSQGEPDDGDLGPQKTAKSSPGAIAGHSDSPWRSAMVPYGQDKGQTLGKLKESTLAWWIKNFTVASTYPNGGRKSAATIDKDKEFRAHLDSAQAELAKAEGSQE